MYKFLIAFLGVFSGFVSHSQDSLGYQWIELQAYPVKENQVWGATSRCQTSPSM